MDHEEKLKQLGQRYEARKREADTKKGALLNTVEALKAEHGIETAEDAQSLIDELITKVSTWEKERDQLIDKIDNALSLSGRNVAESRDVAQTGNSNDPEDGFEIDEFESFEE